MGAYSQQLVTCVHAGAGTVPAHKKTDRSQPATDAAMGADVDDAQLAMALVRREPWAEAVAWNRYWPLVFRLACRMIGSADAAEDVAQDVFFRLFLKAPTLRDPAALRSFVVSITVRVVKWQLRRRRVRRWVMLTTSGEAPDAPVEMADPIARIRLHHLYAILDRLGTRDRTLFVLRHVERFTLEEIAEATGVSLATAKRHVARAAQRVSALAKRDPELAPLVRVPARVSASFVAAVPNTP